MKLSKFLQETKSESKHISWPTKKTTTLFTIAVVLVSFLIGYYIGFFDFLFSYLLKTIL